MSESNSVWKAYRFPIILLCAIAVGCVIGAVMGKDALVLKPLGDLFINAMFMVVVPLVFTTICSAVASMSSMERLGKVMRSLVVVFLITGALAAILMLVTVTIFPPAQGANIQMQAAGEIQAFSTPDQIVKAFTTDDFVNLLSRRAMLPLILFTIFFGFCLQSLGERGRAIGRGISVVADAMRQRVKYLMYYAPIGLGDYFATLVGDYGPQLLGAYFRSMVVYHVATFGYFFVAFTIYSWWATDGRGVRVFWSKIIAPALMALGSGSSTATLPINLEAATNMGIPRDISEIVLPIGATAHMEGSCLSGILKISFLFGIFGLPFTGLGTMATAVAVAVLSGVVLSGIPGGGLVGEMLIVSLYGFPPEAFPIIATIGFLVDPAATMVNATGDTCSALIISRLVEGKDWFAKAKVTDL
ncbi:dicarboxylate/amino acid:cation symporter [uncultured Cloacibacillus sp.]|uniref:dicarboxylate/amino acid:cation symporter n=1 Tax=uncultured Cloacibacillus sp. TaxID=889794 RepID=UPI00258EF9B7|nr:dicarboxylate/amino acid:cation symporter [uncultured Cloacibacillus sp.]